MKSKIFIIAALLLPCIAQAQVLQKTVKVAKAPLALFSKSPKKALNPVTTQPITTAPEGTKWTDVEWSSRASYVNNQQATWTNVSGFVPNVIETDDAVYIQSMITQFADYAQPWLKGEKSADGKTVTFHTPQAYYNYVTSAGASMTYATRLSATTGQVEEGNTDIVFSLENGTLTQTDGGFLALTNANGQFYGYGDMNITITKINDQVNTLPEGVEAQSYKLSYSNTDGSIAQQTAKVGFNGNEVYISNPLETDDSWIKGSLDGSTITVPTKQYLGSSSGYLLYFNAAKDSVYYVSNPLTGQREAQKTYAIVNKPSVTFTYDAETGKISTDDQVVVGAGKDKLGSAYVGMKQPSYEPWTMVPAKPATPSIDTYFDLSAYAAYGLSGVMIAFTIPAVDVDSNFIAPENIYYQISYDGKLKRFFNTDYLPYYGTGQDAASGVSLQGQGSLRQLQANEAPKDSVSIQSFYYVDGQLYPSDIVTYVIKDSASHVVNGIAEINSDEMGAPVRVTYYDLEGRRVNLPQSGNIYIRETIDAKGNRKTSKFIKR